MKKFDLKKIQASTRTPYSQLFALFKRALRIIGDESRPSSDSKVSMKELAYGSFSCEAYILAKRRMHEIETQKAMLISLSRHERWKAGGPN